MALPVTITGISTAVAPVGPFKIAAGVRKIAVISNAIGGIGSDPLTGAGSTVAAGQGATNPTGSSFAVSSVELQLSQVGSPTGNVYVEITATNTAGSVLATSNQIACSTFAGGTYEFTFASPPTIAGSATFGIVVRRTVGDAVNYVTLTRSAVYAGGEDWSYNGTTWTALGLDFRFSVYRSTTVASDAYYFFGRDGTTATTLQAFKSTAPDTSWASITTKTGFTTAILGLSACQVGDVIHIAVMDGTLASSVAQKYVSFDMAADTFGTTETISAAANPAGQVAGVGAGTSLVVRSTGEVVAFYNGAQTNTSGTPRARLYYSRRTGVNTWAAGVRVDANIARDNTLPIVVLGASDRCHFIFHDTNAINQRHLTSANVLGTASAVASTIGAVNSDHISIVDGGNIRHVGYVSSTTVMRFTSADNPTISTATPFTTDVARGVDDNGIVYMLYILAADGDLYIRSSSDFGATWSAATSVFVGAVPVAATSLSKNQYAYQRGSVVVFPYVVNDAGTLKYNERTVRTLSVSYTMPAAVGAVALAGLTTGLRADRRMAAATGAIALAGIAAGGAKGTRMAAAPGAVTLAGQAANLVWRHVYSMPAAKGSVVVTFNDATLTYTSAKKLTADAGAITVSMKAAGLRYGRGMPAVKGSVVLAGQATALRATRYVVAVKGSIAVTGNPANFTHRHAYILSAVKGSVVVTGNPAALGTAANKVMAASPGAVVVTDTTAAGDFVDDNGVTSFVDDNGVTVFVDDNGLYLGGGGYPTVLRADRRAPAVKGAVVVTGNPAGLVTNANKVMVASPGAIALSGQQAALRAARKITAAKGSVALAASATALRAGRALPAAPGAIAVTGIDANLKYRRVIKMLAAPGAIVVTGYAAALSTKLDRAMAASPGAVVLSGKPATFSKTRALLAAKGAIVVSGVPVNLDYHAHMDYRIDAAPEAVVIAGARAELQHGNLQPGRITFGRRAYIPGRW